MRTRTNLHIPGASVRIGDLVEDELTGFEGILTCHSRHLTGCDTAWVTSQTETHDGHAIERVFDIMRLVILKRNPLKIKGFPEDVEPAG